jgi:hypothetical protein
MSVQPFYSPKFRAFDSNGDPLAGGKLYSYEANTETPLATYTTRAGNVANANPVVLDANGEANVWTTPGVDYKFVLKNSAGATQWTVDNVPSPSDGSDSDVTADPGGMLTLDNDAPLVTTDISGATTLYYVPHKSDSVPLWNGSAWVVSSIGSGLSQLTTDTTKSPAAVAVSSNYDLFVWDDNGTIRLSRGPVWTSATVRGTGVNTTELERLDGRWVNKYGISNGPDAQAGLYVGSVRSDASAQLNDSLTKRHVWNLYEHEALPTFASEMGRAVYGETTAATAVTGVATSNGKGVHGTAATNGVGVRGDSVSGIGVHGLSTSGNGVTGVTTTGDGLYGEATGAGHGVGVGEGNIKFWGSNPASSTGFSNILTPLGFQKAGGVVTTDGAGNASLSVGTNIDVVSIVGTDIRVKLKNGMQNTGAFWAWAMPMGAVPCFCRCTPIAADELYISANDTGGAVSFAVVGTTVGFGVFGAQ